MSELDEVLKRLPTLTNAELDQVSQRIKVCRSIPAKSSSKVEDDGDAMMILDAIAQVLTGIGADNIRSTVMYKRLANDTFREDATALMNFIRRQTKNRNEQRALLRLGMELHYKDMLSWSKRPVNVPRMMFSINQVPSVFNAHFPSYAQNGLLGMIVRLTRQVTKS